MRWIEKRLEKLRNVFHVGQTVGTLSPYYLSTRICIGLSLGGMRYSDAVSPLSLYLSLSFYSAYIQWCKKQGWENILKEEGDSLNSTTEKDIKRTLDCITSGFTEDIFCVFWHQTFDQPCLGLCVHWMKFINTELNCCRTLATVSSVTTATSCYCWEEKSFNCGECGSKTTVGSEGLCLPNGKSEQKWRHEFESV